MAEPLPLPTPAQLVTLTALLIPLMRMCLLIVSMGIVACADALTRALFGTLEGTIGWVPFLNRVVQTPIHRIQQKVSNYLGGLETHIDVSMGGYFHAFADAVGRLASGEAETGWVLYWLAKAHHGLRVTVHALPSLGTVTHTVTRVVKQTTVVVKRIDRVGKVATHAAPGSLVRAVRAVAGTLDDVVTWDIPRLRARTKAAEGEIGRLWRWTRAHPLQVGTAAFAGAVAVALARLGLGQLRCSSAKSLFKKRGCGLWRDLDRLLGMVAEVALVANICQVLPWIERGFSIVAAPLIETLTSIGAGLCDPSASPPELLPDPTLYLPASIDDSLHLAT